MAGMKLQTFGEMARMKFIQREPEARTASKTAARKSCLARQ
jgi:hypothetical protein